MYNTILGAALKYGQSGVPGKSSNPAKDKLKKAILKKRPRKGSKDPR